MGRAGLTLRWIERALGTAKRLAVKGSATAIAAVRENSARLCTGNLIPLRWGRWPKKKVQRNLAWCGKNDDIAAPPDAGRRRVACCRIGTAAG